MYTIIYIYIYVNNLILVPDVLVASSYELWPTSRSHGQQPVTRLFFLLDSLEPNVIGVADACQVACYYGLCPIRSIYIYICLHHVLSTVLTSLSIFHHCRSGNLLKLAWCRQSSSSDENQSCNLVRSWLTSLPHAHDSHNQWLHAKCSPLR